MKICIIDSGYNRTHPHLLNCEVISEINISKINGAITVQNNADDQIGHGTAVLSIINKKCKNAEFYIVKIFEKDYECDEDILIYALEYVYNNISCDYINLSLGVTLSYDNEKLYNICVKFYLKNIIIISAFDNNGAVSYPAMFDNVIGVDNDVLCRTSDEFISVKNSSVNVFGYGSNQRVAWVDPLKYMFVNGASFAAAYITSILANAEITNFNDALNFLHENSSYQINFPAETNKNAPLFNIKRAVALPANKEIKSLTDNASMLSFELINIYDYPKLGNVGRKISSLDNFHNFTVKSISDINWTDNFDTVILGHMSEISKIIGYDVRLEIIKLCIQYEKNIFSYDHFNYDFTSGYTEKIYSPEIKFNDHNFGKLYDISVPVVGVFGTSSKQGKFTLQMILRKMFVEHEYKVGQIGTEPSSLLLGMDDVFHFGFGGNLNLSSNHFVASMNNSVNNLQKSGADIIISGCQSNTIPYSVKNIRYLNFRQSEYIIGLNPDCCILSVNPHDDIHYIKRTVAYIESLAECKVIALVIYPMSVPEKWTLNYRKKMDAQALDSLRGYFAEQINIPCYILGNQVHMNELFEIIIRFFSN